VTALLLFGRCLLGLVFLASAVGKARGRREFRAFGAALGGMRLLPAPLVRPAAAAVVLLEALVPLLLALPGRWPVAAGFALAGLLLLAFTAAVWTVLRRRVAAVCRCFGGSSAAPLGRRHIARNSALAAVAVAGAAGSLTAAGSAAPPAAAAVLAVPLAVVGALAAARLDDLVSLFRRAPAGGLQAYHGPSSPTRR
jgi:hypothetical protein